MRSTPVTTRLKPFLLTSADKLEKQVFRSTLDDIWAGTVAHFNERDPKQIERAEGNPKRKMALHLPLVLGSFEPLVKYR